MSDGAVALGAREIALAAALLLLNGALSLALGLRLGRRLVVAALRAGAQLFLLGLVLAWIFELERWPLVVGWMLAMGALAGVEAVRRTSRRVRGLGAAAATAMLAGSMAVSFWVTAVIVGVDPWYEPRYVLPILGMILGNSLTGVSLGLETALRGFEQEREQVELLLAHGATRAEAARDVVRAAVRTGTIPILNSMVAAGAISIPGMMTGQILSGEPPRSAAAWQIVILCAIAASVALGTMAAVSLAARLVFDERARLRVDRIRAVE